MALPASGVISLLDIAGEFPYLSTATPHNISEFYGASAGVPASGTIDMADFYGAVAGPHVPWDDVTNSLTGWEPLSGSRGSLTIVSGTNKRIQVVGQEDAKGASHTVYFGRAPNDAIICTPGVGIRLSVEIYPGGIDNSSDTKYIDITNAADDITIASAGLTAGQPSQWFTLTATATPAMMAGISSVYVTLNNACNGYSSSLADFRNIKIFEY